MAAGWRNAMGAIGLVLGLGALVGVPAAVDAVLPDVRSVADRPLTVVAGVTLVPPGGATHDPAASRPGSGEVVLRAGGLTMRLNAVGVRDRPADFVAHARRKLLRDDGLRPGSPTPVRTDAGVLGERADLSVVEQGAGRPGCFAAFVAESVGVTVVVSPVTGCAAVPDAVWGAVRSLRVESVGTW